MQNNVVEEAVTTGLSALAKSAFRDATEKGLYERYAKYGYEDKRIQLAYRIEDEAIEAAKEADNYSSYVGQLADVIIMACSAAEYLGIDIGTAVVNKMRINAQRGRYHGKKADEA